MSPRHPYAQLWTARTHTYTYTYIYVYVCICIYIRNGNVMKNIEFIVGFKMEYKCIVEWLIVVKANANCWDHLLRHKLFYFFLLMKFWISVTNVQAPILDWTVIFYWTRHIRQHVAITIAGRGDYRSYIRISLNVAISKLINYKGFHWMNEWVHAILENLNTVY